MSEVNHMRWMEFTKKNIGRSYDLGHTDCLALILDATERQGITLPDAFEGITRKTYPEFWQGNQHAAKAALLRFVATLGNEINPEKAFTGDILIMRAYRSRRQYIGIHAGQDRVMTSFTNKGIQTVNIRLFTIEKVYRMNRSQD